MNNPIKMWLSYAHLQAKQFIAVLLLSTALVSHNLEANSWKKTAKKAGKISLHCAKIGTGAFLASYWGWSLTECLKDTRNSNRYGLVWGGLIDTPKVILSNARGSVLHTWPYLSSWFISAIAIADGIHGLTKEFSKKRDKS